MEYVLKQQVDALAKIAVLPSSFRDDLDELRAKAGDDNANWFVSSLAATVANSPNLLAGAVGARFLGKGGWLFSMGGMYAQEMNQALDSFLKIYGVPGNIPMEEILANSSYAEKYQRATNHARAYGLLSAGIEYIQTGSFLKMAGFSKGNRPKNIVELFKNKPTRKFVTTSNFLDVGYFTTASFYSVRDAHTEEEIIPFDDNFTKLSADGESMYFSLYMNGLQPERYYRILFKHVNNDGTTIYDNNYHFKVIR